MRNCVLLFSFLTVSNLYLAAQESQRIVVKAGSDISEVLAKELYLYPEFEDGMVYFKNGAITGGKLNYHRMLGEIQFIDGHSDTLSLTNENTIRYIVINKDSFYFDKNYVALVPGGNASAKLGKQEIIKVADKQKIGAYGQASHGSSIDTYSTYDDGHQLYKLSALQDIILLKKTVFYFGDAFNHFLPANKKNLFAMFPKYERELQSYLGKNVVDFSKKESLLKLLEFIQSL